MNASLLRLAAMLVLTSAGPSRAQTTPTTPNAAPSATAPAPVTPPSGVARGVIRPNRPVDPKMVTHPTTRTQHNMPVIKPPGTAR